MAPIIERGISDLPVVTGRQRLGVFAHKNTLHFLSPVLDALRNDFEIYRYYDLSPALLQDAQELDFCWVEWGSHAYALDYLGATDPACTVLARLHDFEIANPLHSTLPDWDVADRLVFINPSSLAAFLEKNPQFPKSRTVLSTNAVNEFTIPFSKEEFGKRILLSSLGFTERKNLRRALEIFSLVLAEDPSYELVIKANLLPTDHERFAELAGIIRKSDLTNKVSFIFDKTRSTRIETLSSKLDIVPIYASADILLSSSSHEAFHYSIAEGMLAGLFPVVFPWEWGQPETIWGDYVATDTADCARRILDWGALSEKQKLEEAHEARKYVIDNFGLQTTRRSVLEDVLGRTAQTNEPERRKRAVLFAHHHLYRWSPHGGELSMRAILKDMQRDGYDVLVVVRNLKTQDYIREEVDGIPFLVIPEGPDFVLGASEVLDWWQPDVALMWDSVAVDAAPICAGRAIPYVLFIRYWHLINPPPYVELLTDPLDMGLRDRHHHIFQGATSVIGNAKHTADVIDRFHSVGALVSRVPVERLPSLSDPEERKYVTLVNAKKASGGKLVAHLASELPDVSFLVIDRDESDYPPNVTQRGYSYDPYNVMFRDTQILLLPADSDSCGNGRVAFEAQYLGIPVLSVNKGAMPEAIPPQNLVSNNDDASEWVRLIRRTLEDPATASAQALAQMQEYDPRREISIALDAIKVAAENPAHDAPLDRTLAGDSYDFLHLLSTEQLAGSLFCTQEDLKHQARFSINDGALTVTGNGDVLVEPTGPRCRLTITGETGAFRVPRGRTHVRVSVTLVSESLPTVNLSVAELGKETDTKPLNVVRRKLNIRHPDTEGTTVSIDVPVEYGSDFVRVAFVSPIGTDPFTIRDLRCIFVESKGDRGILAIGPDLFSPASFPPITKPRAEPRTLELFVEDSEPQGSDVCVVTVDDPSTSGRLAGVALSIAQRDQTVSLLRVPGRGSRSAPAAATQFRLASYAKEAWASTRIRRVKEPPGVAAGTSLNPSTARRRLSLSSLGGRIRSLRERNSVPASTRGREKDPDGALPRARTFRACGLSELEWLRSRIPDNARLVLDATGIPDERLATGLEQPAMQELVKSCDRVLVNSRSQKAIFQDLVSTPCVDTQLVPIRPPSLIQENPEYDMDALSPFVLCSASPDDTFLPVLLDALSLTETTRLVLMCHQTSSTVAQIQELARTHRVMNRVRFIRRPAATRMPGTVAQASLGIIFPEHEGDVDYYDQAGVDWITLRNGVDSGSQQKSAQLIAEPDARSLAAALNERGVAPGAARIS